MPDGQAAIHKPLSLFLKDPGSISGHKDLDTFIQAPDIQAEQLVSAIRAAESDMKRKRVSFDALRHIFPKMWSYNISCCTSKQAPFDRTSKSLNHFLKYNKTSF